MENEGVMELAENGREQSAVGSSSLGLAKSSEIYLCVLSFLAKCDYSLYLFQEVQFNFFPPDLSLVYFILR